MAQYKRLAFIRLILIKNSLTVTTIKFVWCNIEDDKSILKNQKYTSDNLKENFKQRIIYRF